MRWFFVRLIGTCRGILGRAWSYLLRANLSERSTIAAIVLLILSHSAICILFGSYLILIRAGAALIGWAEKDLVKGVYAVIAVVTFQFAQFLADWVIQVTFQSSPSQFSSVQRELTLMFAIRLGGAVLYVVALIASALRFLGPVDGFHQDQRTSKADEGGVAFRGLVKAHRDTLEAL